MTSKSACALCPAKLSLVSLRVPAPYNSPDMLVASVMRASRTAGLERVGLGFLGGVGRFHHHHGRGGSWGVSSHHRPRDPEIHRLATREDKGAARTTDPVTQKTIGPLEATTDNPPTQKLLGEIQRRRSELRENVM